jgi:hypothetical protein
MPTYTTSANVQLELPSTLPTDFVTNNMTTMIADASAIVDAMVGPDYAFSYNSSTEKFPAIGDTPATPSIIEKCARLVAAAEGYVRLKEINKLSGKDMETKLRRQAEKKLLAIRDGEYGVSVAGTDLRTSKIDHVTDQHIYDSSSSDPIFDRDSLDSFL